MSTINDVAKKAGVNPSTVSRAISNSPRISEATKKKVYAVMKELDYKPNAIARSLATNSKTKIIGLVLNSDNEHLFHNPFFVQCMTGISKYAQDHGYYILQAHSNKEQGELKILMDLVQSNWVDGIVLTAIREDEKCIDYLNDIGLPYVVVGRPDDVENTNWVDNDNEKSMSDVVQELIDLGYKTIGFIGGCKDFKVNNTRLKGYKKALIKNNIEYDENLTFLLDDNEECGRIGMEKFTEYKIPDIIVTTDDLIAYGAYQKSAELLGKNIPVVGYNNTSVSLYRNKAFSTVEIFAEKLGYHSARILVEKLENKNVKPQNYIVQTEFINRGL